MEISPCGVHEAAIRFPFRLHSRTSAPVSQCARSQAAVRLSHKRLFRGEGIMIEVIFAGGNDPAQVQHLSPQGPGAILADSVVLLQTPAVAESTEVGLS
jgi:hypothetical protein